MAKMTIEGMKIRGERIRKLRKNRHVSQVELCTFIGISKNSYARIESGTREMKCSELEKLSEFLNVPINVILGIKPPHLVSDKIKTFAINSGFNRSEITPRVFNFANLVIQNFHFKAESQ